jgi:large subunit ribosomal protein L24
MLSRIRKNDLVVVLSGRDRGKKGSVILVDNKKDCVLVKDVSMNTKHVKPKKRGEVGKIVKEEGLLPMCKVSTVCPSCKKACRVGVRFLTDGKKVRSCHRCKEAF